MAANDSNAVEIDFGRDIWPIVEFRCIECHGPDKQKEGLRFDDLEWLSDEELLGDGDSSESLIYENVTAEKGDDGYMPKKRDPLTLEEKETLRLWLDNGAKSERWRVPETIAVHVSGRGAEPENRVITLAKGLKPAPETALDKLRELGVFVTPLAHNNHLLRVDFDRAEVDVTDEHLKLLKLLSKHVTILILANTQISDDGLLRVSKLNNLTQLHLGNTTITDEAIAHLAKLSNLETLNIIETDVNGQGLAVLKDLSSLKKVYAWNSGVTRSEADQLEDAMPGLKIDIGIDRNDQD
jgi:hypothetical protein